jgi:hypothetical protein
MSGRRYDRILSSTALALILVAPLGARAQDSTAASKQNSKIAATFSERYSSDVQAGRFPYRLVRDSNIGLPQAAPDPARVLASTAEAAGKALYEFSPQKPFSLCWTFQKRSRACASRICGVPCQKVLASIG